MQVPHKIVETFKICKRETSVYSIIIEGDNIKKGSNSLLTRNSSLKILLIFRCIHKSHIWHGGAMVKVAEEKD